MHECENVDVYLYCSSRPIIEDCKGVRFAQLPNFYVSSFLFCTTNFILTDFKSQILQSAAQTGQDDATQPPNRWDQIDDFKWLKAEQSPNWSLISDQDTIPESTWQEIVPGKPEMGLADILEAVKLSQ